MFEKKCSLLCSLLCAYGTSDQLLSPPCSLDTGEGSRWRPHEMAEPLMTALDAGMAEGCRRTADRERAPLILDPAVDWLRGIC